MISGFGQPNITALAPMAPKGAAATEQAVGKTGVQTTEAMNKVAKDDKKARQASRMLQRGAQKNVALAMLQVPAKKRA